MSSIGACEKKLIWPLFVMYFDWAIPLVTAAVKSIVNSIFLMVIKVYRFKYLSFGALSLQYFMSNCRLGGVPDHCNSLFQSEYPGNIETKVNIAVQPVAGGISNDSVFGHRD